MAEASLIADRNRRVVEEATAAQAVGRERLVSLAQRIRGFYQANPGTFLRPRNLCFIVGGSEREIAAACEYLREQGFLAVANSGKPPSYRLQRP